MDNMDTDRSRSVTVLILFFCAHQVPGNLSEYGFIFSS